MLSSLFCFGHIILKISYNCKVKFEQVPRNWQFTPSSGTNTTGEFPSFSNIMLGSFGDVMIENFGL